jgi:protein translocase SecG subunit
MIVFLTTLLILLCLAVVLLILIQRTSGGMGSALGGGAADQYLGAGSAAQLSKLTVWGILFFFILSFGLYALYQNEAGEDDQLLRSGTVQSSVIPNELTDPETSSDILVTEKDVPVDPVSAEPVSSGNSSK